MPSTFTRIGDFFDLVGSAINIANAVEGRHKPRSRDLKKLGIDPAQFRTIRR